MTIKFSTLSEKSKYALTHSNSRINILHGALRSSKNFTMILRWICFITTEVKPDETLCLCGASMFLVESLIKEIKEIVGYDNVEYSRAKSELIVLGKKHVVISSKDENAHYKIMKVTLKGAICEDVDQYPKALIDTFLVRLRPKGAKTFWSVTPDDNPSNYIKVNFIDKVDEINDEFERTIVAHHFTIDDNLSLSTEYVKHLKASLSGDDYIRYIEGKWVTEDKRGIDGGLNGKKNCTFEQKSQTCLDSLRL